MPSERIDSFKGPHGFLSNFWPSEVVLDGQRFPTVEHAYQASKVLSTKERERIMLASTPAAAKRMGRRLALRPDWDEAKLSVMRGLVGQKFEIPGLRDLLLATGDAELVEGNRWGDTFWGECEGVGLNHLGRILMCVRGAARERATRGLFEWL